MQERINIEPGDQIVMNDGERLFVEKKSTKPALATRWICYDGYGEDVVIKEKNIAYKVES